MTTSKNITEAIKASYLQPAFLICVGLLAITAGGMSVAIKAAGIYTKKEPLLLKKSLSDLDKSNLAPYKVVTKSKIDNPDILNTLGTEDYIQWIVEDTSAPADSETRLCMLFITYYSLPDIVPHRPEECYIGGGLQGIKFETVTLRAVQGVYERELKARYLLFADTKAESSLAGGTSFPILYTFNANGKYGDRNDVRKTLNRNLFGKFSYFSKVEWKFYNTVSGRTTYPNKQKAIAASEKLMSVILPVLEKEYWPDGRW
ncbi:MAG: hypothetical protein ABSG97_03280 [Sedimentisphaerales bacterium]|jgi:hypothetical protein